MNVIGGIVYAGIGLITLASFVAVAWSIGHVWGVICFAALIVVVAKYGGRRPVRRENSHPIGHPRAPLHLPEQLDLSNIEHVHLIDRIREEYSTVLMREDGEFKACVYKPAALLPCPKSDIARALEAILSVAEGEASSPFMPANFKTKAAAETIRHCLLCLNDFVDLPSADLPRELVANNMYVTCYFDALAKGATVAAARERAAGAVSLIQSVRPNPRPIKKG